MESPSVLMVGGLSKSFGSVNALSGVSLTFTSGEIHAVLGENGAGKSTLVNVLSGLIVPDDGTVQLGGVPLPLGNAASMRQVGVRTVHQHFMLVPALSVRENLALAHLETLTGSYDPERLSRPAADAARSVGWTFDLDSPVRDLSVGQQQRIEIAKALASGDVPAKVLILDEPTAVLSKDEVTDLFSVLRMVRDQGVAVILVAHKVDEVLAVADRVSVLRQGRLVAESEISQTDRSQLTQWIVGDVLEPLVRESASVGETVLDVSGLHVKGDRGNVAVDGIDLHVREGEIVGIGGVDGNGQREFSEAVAGVRQVESGTIDRRGGIGLIPQDRRRSGLALEMSVVQNHLLGAVSNNGHRQSPLIDWRAVRAWSARLVEEYAIKTPSIDTPAGALSGGNQQKVVVSRVLDSDCRTIVAVNPTRGLDAKATVFVHDCLRKAASEGRAVLLLSTDSDELALLSDRLYTMTRGRLLERALKEAL